MEGAPARPMKAAAARVKPAAARVEAGDGGGSDPGEAGDESDSGVGDSFALQLFNLIIFRVDY